MKQNSDINARKKFVCDETLQFLKELQRQFSTQFGSVPVEHDDPDVRRLIEAMAAFSAYSRVAGEQQINRLYTRIYQQMLPYLVSAVPSMALIQADCRYLTEKANIKLGSCFQLSAADEDPTSVDSALYQTVGECPLYPIKLQSMQLCTQKGNAVIELHISSHSAVPGALDFLPLYAHIHHNYVQSLCWMDYLQRGLMNVSAVFYDHVQQPISGLFHFGLPVQSEAAMAGQPIEQVRQFFQMPQQRHFVNLVFTESPKKWRKCIIQMRFNQSWPAFLPFNQDAFLIGVVPLINRIKEHAAAIPFDATRMTCAVQPPSHSPDLSLLRCTEVYYSEAKQKKALRNDVFGQGEGSYEIEYPQQPFDAPNLHVSLTRAFHKPVKLSLEGLWHQPQFSQSLWKQITGKLYNANIPGLRWQLLQRPVPYIQPESLSAEKLLQLSLLKNRKQLSLQELNFLINALGNVYSREFKALQQRIKSLELESAKVLSGTSNDDCYRISFMDVAPHEKILVDQFLMQLQAIVSAWCSVETVQFKLCDDVTQDLPADDQDENLPCVLNDIVATEFDDELMPASAASMMFLDEQLGRD